MGFASQLCGCDPSDMVYDDVSALSHLHEAAGLVVGAASRHSRLLGVERARAGPMMERREATVKQAFLAAITTAASRPAPPPPKQAVWPTRSSGLAGSVLDPVARDKK